MLFQRGDYRVLGRNPLLQRLTEKAQLLEGCFFSYLLNKLTLKSREPHTKHINGANICTLYTINTYQNIKVGKGRFYALRILPTKTFSVFRGALQNLD